MAEDYKADYKTLERIIKYIKQREIKVQLDYKSADKMVECSI